MKILPASITISFNKTIKMVLIASLVSGCAGIPANKIKVSDYPEAKSEEIKNLDIAYEYYDFVEKRKGRNPAEIDITTEAKLIKLGIKKHSKTQNTKCKIVASMNSGVYDFWGCPIFTNILSIPTLTIIPYYCQIEFIGSADLIDTKTNKTLKTYELKDKVHEVWSLLWMLSWFVVNPTKYAPTAEYPKDAQKITENNISEALTRSILNDASNFEECKKDQTLPLKRK